MQQQKYSTRSKFLTALEEKIRGSIEVLIDGHQLRIALDVEKNGYNGEATVVIDRSNPNEFTTDLELAQPSRFPTRLRATATALRNCGHFGTFRISHFKGNVRVTPLQLVKVPNPRKANLNVEVNPIRPAEINRIANRSYKVGLISCAKEKLDRRAPAAELYTSNSFRKSRLYAEQRLDKYFILSAKYGLLRPTTIIEPYDLTLKNLIPSERKKWADDVFESLRRELGPSDQIVFLAGKYYRHSLERKLVESNFAVATPLKDLDMYTLPSWYKSFAENLDSVANLDRFYALVRKLFRRQGGMRKLGELKSADLPRRGVYFFLESGEFRKTEPFEPRVVRVGTHCVSKGSSSTLWDRLKTHRGYDTLAGKHRSSIFRDHVGKSLMQKLHIDLPTWGLSGLQPHEVPDQEREVEILVSQCIREMSVVWLEIQDESGPRSDRAYIEKNSIALLSTINRRLDTASKDWLGNINPHPAIRESSLWNVDHTNSNYDTRFLDVFEEYVEMTTGKAPVSTGSIAPADWR